jgi:hypothetical protein
MRKYTITRLCGEGTMKKFILCAALVIAAAFPLVAVEGYEVQAFHEDTKDKMVSIDLEYTELTRNLVVIYKVKYRAFDEGDAFIAIRDTVRKFADEHGYKSYSTYSDDIIKYHGNETELTRFIILNK